MYKRWAYGRRMDRIGEDITRELELQPTKLEAHIHVRPKYACRCCKEGVCAAPLPPRPIPGGIAGPGLVSEVIVSKFGDHLPLYRLEDILVRYLHADAFTGYDAIFLGPQAAIREVACWAHARRKFFDAVKSYPRESQSGNPSGPT